MPICLDHTTLAFNKVLKVFVDLHNCLLGGETSAVIDRQVITFVYVFRKVTTLYQTPLIKVIDLTYSYTTNGVDFGDA